MVIKSYNKSYLSNVAENVGTMFEHATNNNIDAIIFWNKFVNSNVAKQIEKGNVKYLTCSGMDYTREVLNDNKLSHIGQNITKNKYYWSGWILTQYQYITGRTFYRINNKLSIERVLDLYRTLHESDVTKFFDVADRYFLSEQSNLQRIRKARGLSQSELAKLSNVKLRSIQMYEQNKNDINKAQAETLLNLAKILGCNIEDLMENRF